MRTPDRFFDIFLTTFAFGARIYRIDRLAALSLAEALYKEEREYE
jgi:hypothetical protein